MPIRFKEVIPNILYRGGAPSIEEIPILKNEFGIQQIISLDAESAEKIASACKQNNIKHIILPIEEGINDGVDTIKAIGAKAIVNNIPSYVHCYHGKDRTGLFVAKYKVEDGMDPLVALQEALQFGFGLGMAPKNVQNYIDVVTYGTNKHISINELYGGLNVDAVAECNECGMIKSGNCCNECNVADALISMANVLVSDDGEDAALVTDPDDTNVVSESKEFPSAYHSYDEDPTNRNVSDLFSIPEDNTLISSYFRQNMLKYTAIDNMIKSAQQISFKVPISEVKKAKDLIEAFNNLADVHINKLVDHIDLLYQPFTDYKGVKPEQAVDATMHFKIFIETLENRMTDFKKKLLKIMDTFEEFSSDSNIAAMLNTISDTLNNADKQLELLKNVMEELNTEDFQDNAVKTMEAIKKEIFQLKQIIVESAVDYIRTHILDENWTTEIREEILDEEEEQNDQKIQ